MPDYPSLHHHTLFWKECWSYHSSSNFLLQLLSSWRHLMTVDFVPQTNRSFSCQIVQDVKTGGSCRQLLFVKNTRNKEINTVFWKLKEVVFVSLYKKRKRNLMGETNRGKNIKLICFFFKK
jgi:hypothetical protein